MTMTDRGMRSRFESEVAPPEELFSRIRTAVAATPASTISTRLRITAATVVVPVLTPPARLVASRIIYERPALGVDLGTQPTSDLLIVLALVIGLPLSATLIVVGRGDRGLGSSAMALFLVA